MSQPTFKIEQILESTTDAIFLLNREWQFTYLNTRARDLISEGKNILGQNVWDLFPEAHRLAYWAAFNRTMIDKVATSFVEYYPEPLKKWFEVHTFPIEEGLSVFFRDISKRNEEDETLRLYQQAMTSMPCGISISKYNKSGENLLVYVNPAFEELTGYSAAEVIGRDCRFLQGNDTEQAARADIRNAIHEGNSISSVLRNYTKDGKEFLNELQLSPVRNSAAAITHYVSIQTDITELLKARERLAHQAHYDSLTGLANHFLFIDRLDHFLSIGGRTGQSMAVIYLDVDNFKYVNDSLGHSLGDDLLKQVGRRICASVRSSDTVARLGGDEFALLLSGWENRMELNKVMDRLIHGLARPLLLGGQELIVTASAGLAVFPEDASTAEQLLRMADQAMFSAKQDRKNSWCAYHPGLQLRLDQPLNMVAGLRRALERNEFVLHYQPRIHTSTGKIKGMEALIRWQHPQGGLIPPGQFIQVAEETGLIIELGNWVIEEALRQNLEWRAAGQTILPISVNVSAAQFRNPEFVESVAKSLERAGLDPALLELELTESLLLESADTAESSIFALKQLGLRIAIDDFGTGFSGLSYLSRFAVDTIKIDQSFTRRIGESKTAAAICRAILMLGQELNLTVVAEGVETQAQASLLQLWKCDEMQGYFFGRPMVAADMGLLLETRSPHQN